MPYVLAFLSTFVIPIPYLGLGAFFGFALIVTLKKKRVKELFPFALSIVVLISLVFVANLYNSVTLNYLELKNLSVLVAAFLYFIYFDYLFFNPKKRQFSEYKLLVLIALGELLASFVFWRLPASILYQNYTWFKYRGGYSLILLIFQLFVCSKYKNKASLNFLLGFVVFIFAFSQNAKSIALMALTVAFFRAIALLSISRRKSKRVSTVKKPINFLPVFLPVVVFLVIFQRLVDLGILGSRLKNFSTEYGGSLLISLFRARAEFPVSMQIFGQMPFLGYGTVSDPLNHLRMNILVSDHLSFGEQGFFVLRLFGDGFDVHSWAFNLIFRAGFLCIIPLFLYLVVLIRCARSVDLLLKYPGLYFMVVTCIVDLFFSPYSWFVPIQIALSFLAYSYVSRGKIEIEEG